MKWGKKTEITDHVYNSDDALKTLWLQHLQSIGTLTMALHVQYPPQKFQTTFRWESLKDDVHYYSRSFSTVRQQQPQMQNSTLKTNRVGFAVRGVAPGITYMHF